MQSGLYVDREFGSHFSLPVSTRCCRYQICAKTLFLRQVLYMISNISGHYRAISFIICPGIPLGPEALLVFVLLSAIFSSYYVNCRMSPITSALEISSRISRSAISVFTTVERLSSNQAPIRCLVAS